jgi:PAS domain S-box-containing protein
MTAWPVGPAPLGDTQSAAVAQAMAAIVYSSADAVIANTVDGVITAWNAGATHVYGYTAGDMIGRSADVLYPLEAVAQERERLARVVAGVAESNYRCVRLRADAVRVEVVMSMSPIYDAEDGVTGVLSVSRAANLGERDDARFAALLEAAPDAILCVDPRGRIITANAQATNMFGYSQAELLGIELEVLLPEQLSERHLDVPGDSLRAPPIRSMGAGLSLSGRRRDGSVFPVEANLVPDRSGPETMVIAAVRDVTEQRRAELAARENETRLRQLAESVDIMFILVQIDPPAYLYLSSGSRSVLGLEPEQLMADPSLAMKLVHPDDRESVGGDYLEISASGRSASSEYRIITPDGRVRWVRSATTPVGTSDGPVERCVITLEDITERKEVAEALAAAEAVARTANEAKNQFLSRMSHELRTPLNAVIGFGQLLQMQLADTEHAEGVGQILKGGRHLLHLINDVLDISSIEAGESSISTEPVAVANLLDETMQLMAPLADEAGVTLIATTEITDCVVLADLQRLRQILLNLLANAVKYNRPGGMVWIKHEISARSIAITVHDDGPGIPHEMQSRLFVPFDRLGAERTGIDGTGIGLSLTRALAELMDGSLTVDSEPGRGSGFTVTLPRATRSTDVRALGHGDDHHHGRHRDTAEFHTRACTLLYIEDNEPNIRVVEHVLKLRPEWRLIHAALGRLGVDLARAHNPDLVLLDLHLPDASGLDVLRTLKDNPATERLPVVILTADATSGLARKLEETGAARYLTKPLVIDDLLAILDDIAMSPQRS